MLFPSLGHATRERNHLTNDSTEASPGSHSWCDTEPRVESPAREIQSACLAGHTSFTLHWGRGLLATAGDKVRNPEGREETKETDSVVLTQLSSYSGETLHPLVLLHSPPGEPWATCGRGGKTFSPDPWLGTAFRGFERSKVFP